MRIVIAPDKFKDSLPAGAVADAIASGVRQVTPDAELDLCPLADGGDGTVRAMVDATGGRFVTRLVTGPLVARKVEATFGFLGDGTTAVIEMAAASGLALLSARQRNPLRATTYGTGELLCHAVALGASHIILGIGGSATVDGGIGCAQACGARITFANGTVYSAGDRRLTGADLTNVLKIQPVKAPTEPNRLPMVRPRQSPGRARSGDVPDFSAVKITVACDVGNPLFGSDGAAAIFGPQKGATPEQVAMLDDGLRQLAQRSGRAELADTPGAGAAGGLGFGMLAFFDATLRSGIELVLETLRLRDRLIGADLCITGEGRLDGQSAAGKAPVGVARLCRELGVPCVAVAGSLGADVERVLSEGIAAYLPIIDRPMTLEEAIADAPRLLAQATAGLLRIAGLRRL